MGAGKEAGAVMDLMTKTKTKTKTKIKIKTKKKKKIKRGKVQFLVLFWF